MKHSFIVTIDVDAGRREAEDYIKTAVVGWGGGLHPSDPFFDVTEERVEVKDVPIQPLTREQVHEQLIRMIGLT